MKKIQNGYFYKYYHDYNLLSSKLTINKRIKLINSFDCYHYRAIPSTLIEKKQNYYIYKQKYYHKINIEQINIDELYVLAESLEYLKKIEFVHGDINKKNIIYTKEGFKIIDFEPDLYQIKRKKENIMITIPYVDKKELEMKKITSNTDKLGFLYFLLRISKKMLSRDIIKLSKTLDHKSYLGDYVNKLLFKSYIDIIDDYKKNFF